MFILMVIRRIKYHFYNVYTFFWCYEIYIERDRKRERYIISWSRERDKERERDRKEFIIS